VPQEVLFGFIVLVIGAVVADLLYFGRGKHVPKFKTALSWTFLWVGIAALFNVAVYYYRGKASALEFLTGYLIEYSLSVDNLFVFILIFGYFRISKSFQRKILFWGIVGAVVMRAMFILGGIALIERFGWVTYLFGALLVVTGIKVGMETEKEIDPEKKFVLRLSRKLLPMTENDEKGSFIIKKGKKLYATPLFIVLILVETTDIVFAVDSIPAIFGITLDRFIVFSSNIFAILGLRSLYFVLAGAMESLDRLNIGLGVILSFVGVKMLIHKWFPIPIGWSLAFIVVVLALSVVASLLWPKKRDK
jgi:tellurite resistance protein TerC